METLISAFAIIGLVFSLMMVVTSGIMCVYGYKWSRQLIGTVALYIGVILGLFVAIFCYSKLKFNSRISIVIFLIIMIGFDSLAYTNLIVNHFIAGFIVALKLSFLALVQIMKLNINFGDWVFIMPIIIGIIIGAVVAYNMNNRILIICTAYIGATTLVSELADISQKIQFAITKDITIFYGDSLEEILINFLGIEIPSFLQFVLIVVLLILSYYLQVKALDKEGIDIDGSDIVDDR